MKYKSWRQKLETELPDHGKIVTDARTGGTLLIPKPLDIDALVRQIPEGKLATDVQIRQRLAKENKADATCPLTTGIFLRIVAETAEEDTRNGKLPVAPYWRVIKADGSLNPKFPGGAEAQAERLRLEGHAVEPGRGKKPPKVRDFEKALHVL